MVMKIEYPIKKDGWLGGIYLTIMISESKNVYNCIHEESLAGQGLQHGQHSHCIQNQLINKPN